MDDVAAHLQRRAEAAEQLVADLVRQLRAAEERDRAAAERDRVAAERDRAAADQNRALQAQIRQLNALVKGMQKQLADLLRAQPPTPNKNDKTASAAGSAKPEPTPAKPSKTTGPKSDPPPPPPERKQPKAAPKQPVRRTDPAPNAVHETKTTPVDACDKCKSSNLAKVGSTSGTRVVYVRAHVRVVEEVRETCRCRDCGAFTTPPAPPTAVPGGIMSPSLLAHIGYSKGFLHLPLNRIAEDLRLLGVDFAKATMSDAMENISTLGEPVVEAIKNELFARHLMWFDGSGIKVLEPGKKGKHLGQITVYSDAEAAVYDYTSSKHGSHAAAFLRVGEKNAYEGYLHADAASNANLLYLDGKIKECGCWYHARDMFVEARTSAPVDAEAGIAWIGALFDVEHEADAAKDTPELRLARRLRDTKPVLDELVKWMVDAETRYSYEEELPKAIRYVRNQWIPLNRFLEDGRIHLTNNRAERDLAPLGRGRKAWLHAGSDSGGEWLADLYTLVETCRREDLDPYEYLVDVLPKLSAMPVNRGRRAADLTPKEWKKTRPPRAPP